jgi:hypothetical protein
MNFVNSNKSFILKINKIKFLSYEKDNFFTSFFPFDC